jgi:hypothetical protein
MLIISRYPEESCLARFGRIESSFGLNRQRRQAPAARDRVCSLSINVAFLPAHRG